MKLSRRQAVLGLLGVASAGGLTVSELSDFRRPGDRTLTDRDLDGLLTVADVVHPTDPAQFETSISGYVDQLPPERKGAMVATLTELDRTARHQLGTGLGSLSGATCRGLLAGLGVDRVQPSPRGTLAERTRFHLVNAVLYAILTTPDGTAPFGIDNPVGYPGGFAASTVDS